MAFEDIADFGGGVQDALTEVIKSRVDRQTQEREDQLAMVRLELQRRGLDLEGERIAQSRDAATYQRERDAAGETRESNRRAYLRTLTNDPNRLASMINTPAGRLALMDEGGLQNPDELLPPEPPKPTMHKVTTRDARGNPIERLVTDDELRTGVPQYQEPRQPQQAPPLERLDLGDRVVLVDRTGNIVREFAKGDGKGGTTERGEQFVDERSERIVDQVDDLVSRARGGTTGMIGWLTGMVPGTTAHDFAADLESLRGNVAFRELTEMRNASKTGGALGQVAVQELRMLEAALGALKQSQSTEQVRRNLGRVKAQIQESRRVWNEANGRRTPGAARMGGPGPGPAQTRPQEYDWVNGKLVPRSGGR